MFGLGPTELIIIAVIVLLIFGAKRLPEIGKGVGGAIREFREVKKELGSKKKADEGGDTREEIKEKAEKSSLEARAVDKVLEQVPGVKKAMDVKKKADAVKKLIQ
jgi:sec-independent protein translocase protein TatA